MYKKNLNTIIPLILLILLSSVLCFADGKKRVIDNANVIECDISELEKFLSEKSAILKLDIGYITINDGKIEDEFEYVSNLALENNFDEKWVIALLNYHNREITIISSNPIDNYINSENLDPVIDFVVMQIQNGEMSTVETLFDEIYSLLSQNKEYADKYLGGYKNSDTQNKTAKNTAVQKIDNKIKVFDMTNTLKPSDVDSLTEIYNKFIEKNKCDIVFAIINDNVNGMTSEEYAKKLYDRNNFGIGPKNNGALMLIDLTINEPGKRRIEIVRAGLVKPLIDRFNEDILDAVFYDVKNLDFAKVAKGFAIEYQRALKICKLDNGKIVNSEMTYNDIMTCGMPLIEKYKNNITFYVIALLINTILTGVSLFVIYKKQNGKILVNNTTYEKANTFAINDTVDTFLYSKVYKVSKTKGFDSGGFGGGSDSGSSSSGGWSSGGGSGGGGGRSF